jgi:Tol biopolymer transport system component/C-terminal processing protease CtpA/Prc
MWWRNGHSNLEQSEIWLRRGGTPASYERVSPAGAREAFPMWSPDATRLFYVSDRGGTENLWSKPLAGAPSQLTTFKDGRVHFPAISHDGRKIAFEREFSLWVYDVAAKSAKPLDVQFRGAPAGPSITHVAATSDFESLALSPDGKKAAFISRGDVFATSVKDGGIAERLTRTPAAESGIAWAPDSKQLVYTSDRGGKEHLYLYNLAEQTETQLTQNSPGDSAASWSPDGKWISFVRDAKELYAIEVATKQLRKLATSRFEKAPFAARDSFAWSPDSKWLAFASEGAKTFCNIMAVEVAGGDPKPLTFLANPGCDSLAWSPDGTTLFFVTGFRTETNKIARVELIPRTPKFREDEFRQLFKTAEPEAKPAASAPKPAEPVKPVEIVFDGIRRRLSFVPVGVDARLVSVSSDGKNLLVTATVAGQQNLYTYSIDELARERPVARQLTSTADPKADAAFSPDSKEVVFLGGGRIQVATVENRQVRTVATTAEMDVNFDEEKRQVFTQAWRYMANTFYDPKFNGIDWAAERTRYEPFVEGSRTPDEMRRVVSLMIGDLNTSHTGIGGPFAGAAPRSGRLGLEFDPVEYETAGKLRIMTVIPLGPAAVAGIKAGSYLLAVDKQSLSPPASLAELLENKVDRRITLTVADAGGANQRDVPVRPIAIFAERNLLYRAWVESRRAYVSEISRGRLGYVHLQAMGGNDLDQLFIDLDPETHGREGVVIDVRNNNGGFIDGHVLDVFARKNYQTLVYDGTHSAPQRIVYGQRALERPTILVTNTLSLSDAECFTEGYRELKLGKVVGEPTSGWVISTFGARLIDGSFVRLPRGRTFTNSGEDMERNPRPVDVLAVRPIGESYTGKDVQLQTAVTELLKQIDSKR